MEFSHHLKAICQKYTFISLSEKINSIETKPLVVKIGFIGEFSSGKSTLINALLGKKLLPAMVHPTSKSIVEVVPTPDIDKPNYWIYSDTGSELQKISASDFSEYATNASEDRLKLRLDIPLSSSTLNEDFTFIDTPGVSSLDRKDTDLTFGYLPELDGVVICSDIQKGSLTQSIIDFISQPEVKVVFNNFLFAITYADTKDEKSALVIQTEIVKQLKIFCDSEKIKIDDIESRVFIVAAQPALETQNSSGIDEFKKGLTSKIYQNKKAMQKERANKELLKVTSDILFALADLKDNLSLDNDELDKKEQDLKTEILRIEKEIEKTKQKFITFETQIKREFASLADHYAGQISVQGDNEIQTLMADLSQDLSTTTIRVTKRFFGEDFLQNFNVNPNFGTLANDITTAIKTIDLSKTVLTAVAIAWICPLTGLGGNASEMLGGAAGKKVAGSLAIAKNGVVQTAKGAAKKGIASKIIGELGNIINQINPIEHLGNYLGQKYISNKAFEEFGRSVDYAASDLCLNMNYDMNQQLFDPLQEKLYLISENIKNSRREKEDLRKDLEKHKEQIIIDESKLKQILLDEE